ncbi:MAG: cytochrome c maturation protein CcmE [Armatimonadota bacterium]|nr:cytochrome c maturation protein CcmE [Armatimonadota bacterium]MDR7464314.1 cytochrome c maturation protein CcmE [Armatimonadota bacterium]MDR7468924.1 cytochrome c maturation protein CcmE [Armatimonadota bacterium]MDR7475036.1 cytochrome c maturation protein CcmE [Armatimonadota bacterium]MDR7539523.1 cytochrome c maturation protein CcmE [Armatimonadota bacterium]
MRRIRLLLAAALVLAALAYVVAGGIRGAVVYYLTPSELLAQGERAAQRAVRVGGLVVPGSKVWDPTARRLEFSLTDGSTTVTVQYVGTPPGLFREGQGAIAEGIWEPGGVLRARSIIVKHSEAYAPPSSGP